MNKKLAILMTALGLLGWVLLFKGTQPLEISLGGALAIFGFGTLAGTVTLPADYTIKQEDDR